MAELGDIINAAATKYGVDPAYLTRVAQIESSMNPNAANGKAKGLYGFMPTTAAHYGLADPFDPVASSDAAARLTRDDQSYLAAHLGRAPTPAELYLAHQQGAGGSSALLQNPNVPAVTLVGSGAISGNGGSPNMTAGQFASMWAQKYGGHTAPGNTAGMSATGVTGNLGTGALPVFARSTGAPAGTPAPITVQKPPGWDDIPPMPQGPDMSQILAAVQQAPQPAAPDPNAEQKTLADALAKRRALLSIRPVVAPV